MEHSWYIIISVFLLYITGSFSSSVLGFIGDSVILPCSIPESALKGAAVHWRDDKGKKVFDIFVNKTAEDQAEEYTNRVETFPDELKKGNVSIRLISLQKTDERMFTCTVTGERYQNETHIKVHLEERPVGRENRGGLHGELTSIVSLLISFSALYLCV